MNVGYRPRRWLAGLFVLNLLVLGASAVVMLRAQNAPATTATTLPYQGYLELAGVPVEGRRYVTFTLYNGDGTPTSWSEGQTVAVAGGRFSALLGAQTALDNVLATGIAPLSIGVSVQEVGADDGMPTGTPVALAGRQTLGSVPYARRGAPGKGFAVDGLLVSSRAEIAGDLRAGSLTAGDLRVSSLTADTISAPGTSQIWSATSTNGLSPSAAGLTTIPGLSLTFTLARPAIVQLIATGTIRLAAQSSGDCQVALAFAVDSQVRGNANHGEALHQMRYVTPTLHQPWALSRTESLTAGAHTIEMRADDEYGGCWVCAEFDGTVHEHTRCHLSLMAFYQ